MTMNHPKGMTRVAYASFLLACHDAGIHPPRIVQTMTGALGRRVKASAGTHDKDGTFEGEAYSCAVDLSVRSFWGLHGYDDKDIKWLLWHLSKNGFVAWYRHTGSFAFNRHIHAVFVGLEMKLILQEQVRDFLNGRTGLVGHAHEGYWTAPADCDAVLKARFLRANPGAAHLFK